MICNICGAEIKHLARGLKFSDCIYPTCTECIKQLRCIECRAQDKKKFRPTRMPICVECIRRVNTGEV